MIKLKIKKNQLCLNTIALIFGLGISIWIFNYQQDQQIKFDVTWLDVNQAVIFWKTENETKGYIKYGESRFSLDQIKHQINERENMLHVVVLENLPTEGIFMTLHTDQESVFRRPKIINIKYTPPEND